MPKDVTRDSGVDAVTHCIESLVSSFASPYTHALSLRALHDLFTTLPAVYADGEDMELRTRVHNAATMAQLAFEDPSIRSNPRASTIAELEQLLDEAWKGW